MAPLFGSSITCYTGQPSQNGPSSSHVFLSLLSRKKAPLRVPISSSVCDIEVVPPSRIEWPTYQTGGAAKNHLSLAANATAPKMWLRLFDEARPGRQRRCSRRAAPELDRDFVQGRDLDCFDSLQPGFRFEQLERLPRVREERLSVVGSSSPDQPLG